MSPAPAVDALALLARASSFTGSMADLAQLYAEAGVPVFPCHPDEKRPLNRGGFRRRSADSAVVRRWWEVTPNALVGLVPRDLGLAALDVDSTKAAVTARDAGLLADPVFVVETGGKSAPFEIDGQTVPPLHVYIRPAGALPNIAGLVIRDDKGYVIAPGSRRPNGRAWRVRTEGLGGWACAGGGGNTNTLTASIREARPGETTSLGPKAGSAELTAPDFDRVRAAVAVISNQPETSREQYVAMAHAILGASGAEHREEGLSLFTAWAAKWEGGRVDPAEDERVYNTIRPADVRTGWPQLHRLAEKHGYDNRDDVQRDAREDFPADSAATMASVPPPARDSLYKELLGLRKRLDAIPDALEREIVRAEGVGKLAGGLRIPFSVVRDGLASLDAPHRTRRVTALGPGPKMFDALATTPAALVAGYLFPNQDTLLFGEPGSLKTFVALDLALSVASGRKWLGSIPTLQTGVVFFAGEASTSLFLRVAAWCAAHGLTLEESERLPFVIIDMVPTFGRGPDGVQHAITQVRDAEKAREMKVGLVVFDNMTRIMTAAGLSNIDPGEYGRVLGDLDRFARSIEVTTLTISHSPKSDSSTPSGTYQGLANPDVILRAERAKDALGVKLSVVKARSSKPAPPLLVVVKVEDVRDFLRATYAARKIPIPPSLSGASDFAEGGASRDDAFTSLVVDGGKLVAQAKASTLEDRVLNVIAGQAGRSIRQVRKAVGGKASDVDRAIHKLEAEGLVTETRGLRGAHLLSATPKGNTQTLSLGDLGGGL